jgi:hypothetical protein
MSISVNKNNFPSTNALISVFKCYLEYPEEWILPRRCPQSQIQNHFWLRHINI